MTQAKLDVVLDHWFPRFIANEIDYLDVRRITDEVNDWSQWPDAWSKAADTYRRLGESALEHGRRVTAGEHLRRAALTLHFAQFVLTEDEERRAELHRRQIALYRRAAPLLMPPARPIAIPFEGALLHGYLRTPAHERRAHLVVLIPGLESTKEQFTSYEPYFLNRGVATLSIEGPGQGETWYELPFRDADYRRAMARVSEFVGALEEIDATRVVVLGTSFGGYLALRCAPVFTGLEGVVAIAGPYELALEEMLPVAQDGFVRLAKARNAGEAAELLSDVSLRGRLGEIDVPTVVLHGERDGVVPVSAARRIGAEMDGRAELWIEPDGNHSCNNLHTRVRPMVADWVAERLGSG